MLKGASKTLPYGHTYFGLSGSVPYAKTTLRFFCGWLAEELDVVGAGGAVEGLAVLLVRSGVTWVAWSMVVGVLGVAVPPLLLLIVLAGDTIRSLHSRSIYPSNVNPGRGESRRQREHRSDYGDPGGDNDGFCIYADD